MIGEEGSDERKHADLFLNHIVAPVVKSLDYKDPIRADQIAEPGIITNQIVSAIRDADLVIADLSIVNGNVYYELAVGHAAQKPVIPMALVGSMIPFDNAHVRTVFFGTQIDEAEKAKDKLLKAIRAAEASKKHSDNPIGQAIRIETVASSKDIHGETLAELLENQTNLLHLSYSMISRLNMIEASINSNKTRSLSMHAGNVRYKNETNKLIQAISGETPESPLGNVLRKVGQEFLEAQSERPPQELIDDPAEKKNK